MTFHNFVDQKRDKNCFERQYVVACSLALGRRANAGAHENLLRADCAAHSVQSSCFSLSLVFSWFDDLVILTFADVILLLSNARLDRCRNRDGEVVLPCLRDGEFSTEQGSIASLIAVYSFFSFFVLWKSFSVGRLARTRAKEILFV